MSLAPNEREALRLDLNQILGFTRVGPVTWPNLVLAQRRTIEWQSEPVPSDGERGGSSSPREVSERAEDRQVASQAARDQAALERLIPEWRGELTMAAHTHAPTRELAEVSRDLARIVARCVVTVDHSQLPDEVPGCSSCDRLNRWKQWKGGPVWEGLSGKAQYAKKGLCSWCGRHGVPPLEFVALKHSRGESAAGRALAKHLADQDRRCGHPVWTDAGEVPCGLGFMHEGACQAETRVA